MLKAVNWQSRKIRSIVKTTKKLTWKSGSIALIHRLFFLPYKEYCTFHGVISLHFNITVRQLEQNLLNFIVGGEEDGSVDKKDPKQSSFFLNQSAIFCSWCKNWNTNASTLDKLKKANLVKLL